MAHESSQSPSDDEVKGWFFEEESRIISFRVETFQALADSLTGMAGAVVAKTLLYKVGTEMGRRSFDKWKTDIRNVEDLLKVFDLTAKRRGWGRIVSVTSRKENGKTVYTFTRSGTPSSYNRRATEPTCNLERGTCTGWIEGYEGRTAHDSVETKCVSTGEPFCIFEITFH